MILPRHLLAASCLATLILVGSNLAQTRRSKLKTLAISNNPTINVNDTPGCIDVEDNPSAADGPLTWQIDTSNHNVSDFHIMFTKKSPSQKNERYFDSKRNTLTTIKNPKHDAEVFEYIIEVDVISGPNQTCDPHVIVIKGSGDGNPP